MKCASPREHSPVYNLCPAGVLMEWQRSLHNRDLSSEHPGLANVFPQEAQETDALKEKRTGINLVNPVSNSLLCNSDSIRTSW
jgi:hypothetical protein